MFDFLTEILFLFDSCQYQYFVMIIIDATSGKGISSNFGTRDKAGAWVKVCMDNTGDTV